MTSRVSCSAATLLLVLCSATRAIAEPRGRAEPDVDLGFLSAPPPAPPEPSPPPRREEEEFPRRAWELAPRLGLAVPLCRGDATGEGRCDQTTTGSAVGAGLLWRIAPYVALGVEADLSSFHLDAAEGSSRSTWVGAVVRGYFLDRGWLDPWVQTGFGRGSIDTAWNGGNLEARFSGSGPATMAQAGLDFWISDHLKLGPAFAYYWTLLRDLRACSGPTCAVSSVGSTGAVGSYATVSIALAIALGREM